MKQLFFGLITGLFWITTVAFSAEQLNSESINSKVMAASQETQQPIGLTASQTMTVGVDVRWAPIQFAQYSYTTGVPTEKNGHAALISLEWLAIERFGKLGLGLGSGFFAQPDQDIGGNRFASLYAIPLETHLSYHFDYWSDQFVVPFATVGTSITFLRQASASGAEISGTQQYQGWEYSFGGQLCLNAIDRHGAKSFNKNFGVNNTYLIFQYSRSQPLFLTRAPDLSYQVYQLGFRLEI